MRIQRRALRTLWPVLLAAAAGCGGGGSGSGALSVQVTPQLLVGRARIDQPHRYAEIALRDLRNLGTDRVGDRAGPESGVDLHPDGVRVVFARERQTDDPDSRELFVSTIDGSAAELRLTVDTTRDDDPSWSPTGDRVLFASERDGARALWTCGATGDDPELFLPPPTGFRDDQPDWNAVTDRIVFRRRGPGGVGQLWLVAGNGANPTMLTDGGGIPAGSVDLGDGQPAFDDTGAYVLFVRRTAANRSNLCRVELATQAVTTMLTPTGEVSHPQFAPGGRVLFGLAEPAAGRATLRLSTMPLAGGEPVLLWPDERWAVTSIEVVPWSETLAIVPTVGPTRVDVRRDATFSVALASDAFGSVEQFEADDGNEYYLRTAPSGARQVAGLRAVMKLPVTDPLDVATYRFTARVRVTQGGGDSVLRLSLRNPFENRSDTVVELPVAGTTEQELTFLTSSLRHVARDGTITVNVIADLDADDRVEFWIDQIACDVVAYDRG